MINNEHDVQDEPTVTFEDTSSYRQKSGGGFPTGAKVALSIIAVALVLTIIFAVCLLAFIGVCCFVAAICGLAFIAGAALGIYLYIEYKNGNIELPSWLDRSFA
ncbi:MAG: hypothetical protein J6A90_03185 [Clostridia bacterium]|nr:hypothetical protein [Clostridia bacterium]